MTYDSSHHEDVSGMVFVVWQQGAREMRYVWSFV